MTIGAVFATFNRSKLAREAAEALLADPTFSQVVVVDDCSCDDTQQVLGQIKDPRFDLLTQSQNSGRSAARARGIGHIKTDLVLLLDDDVIAQPGLGAAHLKNHLASSGNSLVVVGYMPVEVNDSTAAVSRIYSAEYEGAVAKYKNPQAILEKLWGGNVSYPRQQLRELTEHTDNTDSYHEDQVLGRLARAKGMSATFDRTARAVHRHNRPLEGFISDARKRGHACRQFGQPVAIADTLLASRLVSWIATHALAPVVASNTKLSIPGAKVIRRCAFAQGLTGKNS